MTTPDSNKTNYADQQRLDLAPTILLLREHCDAICRAEIDRVRGRLGQLSQDEMLAIEAFARGITTKIMRAPSEALKLAQAGPNSKAVIDLVKCLFGLDDTRTAGSRRSERQRMSAVPD